MNSTLKEGEPHPSAQSALHYVQQWVQREGMNGVALMLESLASTALSGNRLAQICGETLDRVIHGNGVSDRYILGLAWFLRNTEEITKKS